jgi:hypothetical protein
MRNLTILLSDKLQKCWLCRHTFMANSPLVAIGNRVSHPGSRKRKSYRASQQDIASLKVFNVSRLHSEMPATNIVCSVT